MKTEQKKLILFILENQKLITNWNEKFYTDKNENTSIYLDNVKFDVTVLYQNCRDTKGFFHLSRFVDLYNDFISDMIDCEMDLDFGDITQQDFDKLKKELLSTL